MSHRVPSGRREGAEAPRRWIQTEPRRRGGGGGPAPRLGAPRPIPGWWRLPRRPASAKTGQGVKAERGRSESSHRPESPSSQTRLRGALSTGPGLFVPHADPRTGSGWLLRGRGNPSVACPSLGRGPRPQGGEAGARVQGGGRGIWLASPPPAQPAWALMGRWHSVHP